MHVSLYALFLTSPNGHILLQHTDVELQCELRGGAQEGLNDGGSSESGSVSHQLALGLPDFMFHLLGLATPRHLFLPSDGDIWLLHLPRASIDTKGVQTPEEKTVRRYYFISYKPGFLNDCVTSYSVAG